MQRFAFLVNSLFYYTVSFQTAPSLIGEANYSKAPAALQGLLSLRSLRSLLFLH